MPSGLILDHRFRLDSLLGRGGMGAVWLAHDYQLDAPVAVKVLSPLLADTEEGVARFNREAQTAAAIRGPHVVQIIHNGSDPATGLRFIAMELMEGDSLATRLKAVGTLPPQTTARIMTHVARALAAAHAAAIVHRDLKPDNIFLVRNDDEEIAKVLDFGIAKSDRHRLAPDGNTRTGTAMGTPYYMSPEQIRGAKDVDYNTDIWALGVIAFQCLTGQLPFNGGSLGDLTIKICSEPVVVPSSVAEVPPGFDAWFQRAVHREPAKRFASALEAAAALREVCSVSSPSGRSATSPDAIAATLNVVTANTAGAWTRRGSETSAPSRLAWMVIALGSSLTLPAAVWVWSQTRTETASQPPANPPSLTAAVLEVPTTAEAAKSTGEPSLSGSAASASETTAIVAAPAPSTNPAGLAPVPRLPRPKITPKSVEAVPSKASASTPSKAKAISDMLKERGN